jgi:hypothetical protein hcinC1_04687
MSLYLTLKDKLPSDAFYMKDKLDNLSEDKARAVSMLNLKSPLVGLVLGLCFGALGVDRFYKGDILLGILKLVTFGGLFIWALIDLFLVYKGIQKDNLNLVNLTIM